MRPTAARLLKISKRSTRKRTSRSPIVYHLMRRHMRCLKRHLTQNMCYCAPVVRKFKPRYGSTSKQGQIASSKECRKKMSLLPTKTMCPASVLLPQVKILGTRSVPWERGLWTGYAKPHFRKRGGRLLSSKALRRTELEQSAQRNFSSTVWL